MIPKIHIVTLALDAMPFLPMQLSIFNGLRCDWTWHIIEGVADAVHCTQWCAKISPRLSRDGTTEFLNSLRFHPRVRCYQRQLWDGKIEMLNFALAQIHDPCVLLEVDADEIWQAWQIDRLVQMFTNDPSAISARFFMRYFVGPNLIVQSVNTYGNKAGEWHRAWRFRPGNVFVTHEPPEFSVAGKCVSREATRKIGLIPDHWSYVFRSQLEFKAEYYQYTEAVAHWLRLQHHSGPWPVLLREYFPWVEDNAEVAPLHT